MRLGFSFCNVRERKWLRALKNERRSKSIGKAILRALVDVVIQSIWEWIATTGDLEWLLKILIFIVIIKCCGQFLCYLVVVFFIVWLIN